MSLIILFHVIFLIPCIVLFNHEYILTVQLLLFFFFFFLSKCALLFIHSSSLHQILFRRKQYLYFICYLFVECFYCCHFPKCIFLQLARFLLKFFFSFYFFRQTICIELATNMILGVSSHAHLEFRNLHFHFN